jgi:hypothetical protein
MSAAKSGRTRFLTRANQLVRQPGPISDRTLEVTFLDPGVQAYAFTFG